MTQIDIEKITISHKPDDSRYEARDGEALAGIMVYKLQGTKIVFTHTEVPPAYEGQGIAQKMVAFALDAARSNQYQVVAQCPFVTSFIRRHKEYQDI